MSVDSRLGIAKGLTGAEILNIVRQEYKQKYHTFDNVLYSWKDRVYYEGKKFHALIVPRKDNARHIDFNMFTG